MGYDKYFPLSLSEITITPLDFSMLTGLPFSGLALSIRHNNTPIELCQLFVPFGANIDSSLIPLKVVANAVANLLSEASPEQWLVYFCCVCLALLCSLIRVVELVPPKLRP